MFRSDSYDELLSGKLHNPLFAKSYLLELTTNKEEPMEIEDALKFVIRKMGVTEFANLIGENKANVGNFLNGRRSLKEETLNKYLMPFNLKVKKILEDAA